MIEAASFVAVNDYEGRLLGERTGWSQEAIARRVDALIVTLGAAGARIHVKGKTLEIPVVKAAAVVDPTGCGDAYRAALLFGLMRKLSWEETGRLASLLGAIKIAHKGTQNHHFTRATLVSGFKSAFGQAVSF